MTEQLLPPAGIAPAEAGKTIVNTRPAGALLPGTATYTADEALAALYAEQSQTLLRTATLLIWSEGKAVAPDAACGAAEEIVHDAFTAMHREWRRVRDAERATAYLRRAIVSGTRTRRRGPGGPLDGAIEDGADVSAAHVNTATEDSAYAAGSGSRGARGLSAMSSVVLTALRRMPGRQREALVLRYYADLPEAQAAAAMGVSEAAFRGHAARGMAVLASVMRLSTADPTLCTACSHAVHSVIHSLYQAEVAGLGTSGVEASAGRVGSPGGASATVSGSVSAAIAARYLRQASTPTAPAPASTVAARADQVKAFRHDDRFMSSGLTCCAVVRSAAETFGAMFFTRASEIAGAAVDSVKSAAFCSRGAAQPRALSVLARRPAFMFAAAVCAFTAAVCAACAAFAAAVCAFTAAVCAACAAACMLCAAVCAAVWAIELAPAAAVVAPR